MHRAEYTYDGLRPTLRLISADVDRVYEDFLQDGSGAADYTERSRSLGADVTLGFPGPETAQSLTLGYRYRELSSRSPLPPWDGYGGPLPAVGSLGSTYLAWGYSDARRQPLSISTSGGRTLALWLERFQEGFGSDWTFTRAAFTWNEYVDLPAPRHVLAARIFVGSASGGIPQQGAFSLGGGAPLDLEQAPGDWPLLLRGYPDNAFSGEQALLASVEYRFPLSEAGRGGVSVPLFLRRVHGALFVDAGDARDAGGFDAAGLHVGAGAEVRADLLFCYSFPVSLRLGVAAGFDERGEVRPTLALWIPQSLLEAGAGRGGDARQIR